MLCTHTSNEGLAVPSGVEDQSVVGIQIKLNRIIPLHARNTPTMPQEAGIHRLLAPIAVTHLLAVSAHPKCEKDAAQQVCEADVYPGKPGEESWGHQTTLYCN